VVNTAGGGGAVGDFTISDTQVVGATPGFSTPAGPNDTHYGFESPTDDPTIVNITFRKTAGPIIPFGLLATVSLTSNVGTGAQDSYASGAHTDPADLSNHNASQVLRPSVLAVPEPGTMALFGLGAVGFLLKFRRRRKTGE
jgi:hypothetical protein